ncbi:hypothetical protein ACFL6M_06215 [Candidatus Eisenbacteria bacterium]|uniref:Uncharacterized protein n=1 Tax=Eiseniibacteriota bacterium TaxID=2212470 RepID=A0ABV6YLH4_UNCEI
MAILSAVRSKAAVQGIAYRTKHHAHLTRRSKTPANRIEIEEVIGMSLWQDFDKRARRLGILDTKLAQAAAIFFALIIVKLVPQIMTVSTWWFVALAVLCAIRPMLVFYGSGRKPLQQS